MGEGETRVRGPHSRLLAQSMVGRQAAWTQVERLLARDATSPPVIQVTGEAGIGKTRMVRAVAELARAEGRLVVEGRARSGDVALPFAVVQDALRALRRSEAHPPATDDPIAAAFPALLLPELGGGADGPAASRAALLEAAARHFAELARAQGLVLILEDLQWADPSSNSLVLYFAQTLGQEPLSLVVTYRPEDARPGSSLNDLRRDLRRERLGEEIQLVPLGDVDVEEMLADILGVVPDERARAAIIGMSGGVPFVVEEVVRDAVERGRLDLDGTWRGELALHPPASVRGLLLASAAELDQADRELLRWAAVIGDRLDVQLLAAVTEVGEDAVLAALARLRDAGLLVEDPIDASGLNLSFRHALTREAVLDELLTAERRRRHARVLDVAEARYGDAPDAPLAELAGHALAAGDRDRGVAYSVRAARRALELCGYDEAEAHFEHALALWTPGLDPSVHAGLLLDYGRLLARARRDPRGERLLREARAAYLELGDRIHAAEALAVAAAARLHNGERAGVLEDLAAARAELRPDDPSEAHLHLLPLLADTLVRTGDLRAAIRVADDGLAMTSPPQNRAQTLDRVHLLTTYGTARWLGGEADTGREALLDALALAREGRDDLGATRACFELACAHLSGPAKEAVRWADEGLETARTRGTPLSRAWMCSVRALIHVRMGEWDDAEDVLGEADRLMAEVGPDPVVRLGLEWIRGERLIGMGSIPDALATLARASNEADALEDLQATSRARLGLARARLAAGDPVGAAEAIGPAIARWEEAAPGRPLPAPPTLLLTAIEIAVARRDAAVAEMRGRQIATRLRGHRALYAAGLVELAAGRTPKAGTLAAAAAAADAAGRRREAGRMGILAAEALIRGGGARQEARGLATDARERLRALGAQTWARRAEALTDRLGSGPVGGPTRAPGELTPREREVLGLLTEGRSNRAIAGALVISEATVVRHVANIYAKLQVHSRAQATRVALEQGLLGVSPPT